MNDDELKKLWQQQPLREPPSAPQLMSAMHNKATLLRRCVERRDIGELVACAVVIIVFGCYYVFLHGVEPIARLGDLIVIGSTVFVAFKLVYARRSTPPAPPGATIVESLRAELKAVRAQSQLLGSILWWYILPGSIGGLIMTFSILSATGPVGLWMMVPVFIILALLSLAFEVFVYRLNRRARAKQLLPLEAQLESLLHSAETGEPLDETQMTNLKPIVLSAAAADQVKPVEFKVAFWQFAIFGVPGIVGIWFFWMFDLTKHEARNANELPPRAVVQTVHFDATNRYSIVARKVVDLFNAGDYAGVQNLYNPTMSQVFPPKQTADFYTRLAADGKIEHIEGPIGKGFRGWTAFRLYCQRGEMIMSLALDTDDKISGIHFRPVLVSRAGIGWRLLRVFSWRHLVWLPLFFAGGLLYSWLAQVWVGRALGISVLGVQKGLDLILWEEIKEIRLLKFLHIRNLWLIKESGEKTLIHWTPLERHSDVRAAVERCAPPDHPIRKYLSLLKRF